MERDIDYVIAIAECRSISKAAETLYISQPSLSRYISGLEEELGVNLFIRTINGTELTEAGKIYVEYAKEIRLLRGTLRQKLKEFKRSDTSQIRIGMTLNAASLSAFNVAEEVKKRYPNCSVQLFNLMSKDIAETLKEGKYDFCIGPSLGYPADYETEMFYKDPMVLVVPDRYNFEGYSWISPGAYFPFVDPRSLPEADYVFQEETTSVWKAIRQIMKNLDWEVTPRLVVVNSLLALQAAENGMGCCIVAMGHLAYLNNTDHLKLYQIYGSEDSAAGAVYLRSKKFSAEERYCIACIKRALTAGEQEIISRVTRGKHTGGLKA